MNFSRRFVVWVVDDQLGVAVADRLTSLYGTASIVAKGYEEAGAAAKEAADASSPDQLPDLALIDLRFNVDIEGEFLKDLSHVQTDEIRNALAESKNNNTNQAGFWVAQEIRSAAHRLNCPEPIIQIYTASMGNIAGLAWAVAPSPYCREACLDVIKKSGTVEDVVEPVARMLRDATKRRFGRWGTPPPLMDLLDSLNTLLGPIWTRQMTVAQEVLETLFNAAEAVSRRVVSLSTEAPKHLEILSLVPTHYLTSGRVGPIHLALNTIFDSVGDNSVRSGLSLGQIVEQVEDEQLSEAYKRLREQKTGLDTATGVAALTREESGEFDGLCDVGYNPARMVMASLPELGRWLQRGNTFLPDIVAELNNAFQLLAEGDYHWALCRALRKVRTPSGLQADTPLAEACHGCTHSEGELEAWLAQYPLPDQTKEHLRNHGIARQPAGLLGLAQQQALGDRRYWEHTWGQAHECLKNRGWTVTVQDVGDEHQLTDWRLFFGHNTTSTSLVETLESELSDLTSGKCLQVTGLEAVPDATAWRRIRLVFQFTLKAPLSKLPAGGLLGALLSLRCWGTAYWAATIRSGVDKSFEHRDRIWPTYGDTLFPDDVELPGNNFFVLVWDVPNYLPERTQ